MRHLVIAIPDWIGPSDSEDVLRQPMEGLSRLTEAGQIFRLAMDPPTETPESLLLGLDPALIKLRQGPLTISALGADPPDRSTHFHLSLLEFSDGVVRGSDLMPELTDLRLILAEAAKLNTKSLTLVPGEARDHGLVWEGLGDLATVPAREATDKPLKSVLPEGDAEPILRRYIDDSINLLSDLELNQIRVEEGLPPFNLLWPWGHGVRTRVPNLAIRRGTPSLVISPSMRMQGLARLAGYLHEDRHKLRSGVNLNLKLIWERIRSAPSAIVYISGFAEWRATEKLEEAAWFTRQLDDEIFAPLAESLGEEPLRLTLVAPSDKNPGLALQLDSGSLQSNTTPFDHRPVDDPRVGLRTSWEAIRENLE
jgi:hypothetical protein